MYAILACHVLFQASQTYVGQVKVIYFLPG